jgi:nicotinamide-nucleotide amidase
VKTAEIVSVGTELLLGQIIDTHAPVMAQILAECGIGCQRRSTIGDNFNRLTDALRESLSRADVLVTIGGLGPTMDDLTRDAIAAAIGDSLVRDEAYEAELRAWFASRNYQFAESNAKQADRPESGVTIKNPFGTAPGLLCQKNGKVVIALPGPKGEFVPMAQGPVREFLETLGGGVIHSRVLRVIGIGESMVEQMLAELMDAENPTVAPYAHTGEVHLRVTARAKTKAEANVLIDPVEAQIRSILGDHLYGTDDTTLEESLLRVLESKAQTVAVAESMTGGQLAGRLTAIPGASKVFIGGWVTYTVSMKENALGIPGDLISEHGPVSAAVAEQMATAARIRSGATFGIAITGNAGPTADVDGKPVGLVFISTSTETGTKVEELKLLGTREDIQRRATQTALSLLLDVAKAD